MTEYKRIRRRQILREAEGYLDLILAFEDRWPPRPVVRDRFAQKALDLLQQLDDFGGHQSQALYLSGQALKTLERYHEAVEPLRQASELDPDNIHVWLLLGWCHKRCGRLDLAIQALEEALVVESGEGIVYYNLACYWSLAQNPKLALAYLSRAFDLDPNYRDLVAEEGDFDPIRSHPDFQSLTSVIV